MLEEIKNILIYLIGVATPTTFIIVVLICFPEKIEIWISIFWKILSRFNGLFKYAHKKYVVHDLQGRINCFVKKLEKETATLGNEKFEIEFVDDHIDRKSFFNDDRVVIRLKRNDPEDHNFVHGTYLFVSTALLIKCKKYLSQNQKEAVDLFTCSKIINDQKPSVTSYFVDEYLHKKTEKSKSSLSLYLDDFKQIDDANLYFPILLQEFKYLGDKVFGRKRDEKIILEVKSMISVLKNISNRQPGDDTIDLEYFGNYCKFSIVIVGKIAKISESIDPYEKYIKNNLLPRNINTIYLVSKLQHKEKLLELCSKFKDNLFIDCQSSIYQDVKKRGDGSERSKIESYLVVLRRCGIDLIQSSSSSL